MVEKRYWREIIIIIILVLTVIKIIHITVGLAHG